MSKFSWRKIRFMKISVDSFNIAQNWTYYFRFWRWKAELIGPKISSDFMVCSIQNIFQEAEASLPVFPWVPPKIHWKPEGMLPKNFCFIVICFLQAFIEPWKPNDRLHGIPGHDPDKESRKTPLKGGRKFMQGERHLKFEITTIRKNGTNSSDFSLKSTSNSRKPELPVPKNQIHDVIH